jgi:lincosamide nucleotidyltransferase A/C/D/E
VDAAEVLRVLDALDSAGIRAGITGGWGIDALLRRETRQHGDLDLGVSTQLIDAAIAALEPLDYVVELDERPARISLVSEVGKVDLHPIVWDPSGAGVQVGLDGEHFAYPAGSLDAQGEIGGRVVRCATPELQVAFHSHYEPREHDRRDMAALAAAFHLVLPPAYLT